MAGNPKVAPFKLEVYLTARGQAVLFSKLYWVWLSGIMLMLVLMGRLVWGRGVVVVGCEVIAGYIVIR